MNNDDQLPGGNPSSASSETESLCAFEEVDLLCSEFDAAFRSGGTPDLEEFFNRRKLAGADTLLCELLKVDAEYRRKRGEMPAASDYLPRLPEFADLLLEFFRVQADTLTSGESTVIPGTEKPGRHDVVGSFGDYEILSEVARGGMGVVYRARHRRLNRVVALKMILDRNLASADSISRFYIEARAAGNLDHPNIVPVFDVGEHEGQHFLSMAFIEGMSLKDYTADGPTSSRMAAELTRTLALAIDHAHQQGVIHRDLKPANVLLEIEPRDSDVEDDESSRRRAALDSKDVARGLITPKLTDFGLAKSLDSPDSPTLSGQIMGTPPYMPPEQARGDLPNIGPHSDIYSIGATLYQLLTGRPPFQTSSVAETLRQVIEGEVVPPQRLNPAVDRDVETICLKCLEYDPDKRYATAAQLAEDLQRYLNIEPILARPVGRIERAFRWCRRNPRIAWLSGTLATLLLLITVGASIAAGAFRRQNIQLSDANDEVSRKNDALTIRSRELAIERDRVKDERDKARKLHALARNAIRNQSQLSQREPMLHFPGMESLRHKLLKQLIEYYRDAERIAAGDKELITDFERAETFLMLGSLKSDITSASDAEQFLKKAEKLLERLLANGKVEKQSIPLARELLAMLYNDHANNYLKQGKGELASKYAGKLMQLVREVDIDELNDVDRAVSLTLVIYNAGIIASRRGNRKKSEGLLQELTRRLGILKTRFPRNAMVHWAIASSELQRGNLVGESPTRAGRAFNRALIALQKASRLQSGLNLLPQFTSRYAVCLSNLAHTQAINGETLDAIENVEKAIELQKQNFARQSQVIDHSLGLIRSYRTLAYVQSLDGEPTLAVKAAQQGIQFYSGLLKKQTAGRWELRLEASHLHYMLGHLLLKDGQARRSIEWFTRAEKFAQESLKIFPQLHHAKILVPIILLERSKAYSRLRRFREALGDVEIARRLQGDDVKRWGSLEYATALIGNGRVSRGMALEDAYGTTSSPEIRYERAAIHALAAEMVQRDATIPAARARQLERRFQLRAVAELVALHKLKYFASSGHPGRARDLLNNGCWKSVRNAAPVQSILRELAKKAAPF